MAYDSIFPEQSWLGVRGLLALAVLGLAARFIVQFGGPRYRGTPALDEYQLAYLSGGADRVALALLAGLHAQRSIRAVPTAEGPLGYRRPHLETLAAPAGGTRLERAAYDALARGTMANELRYAPAVRAIVDAMAESLAYQGFLMDRRRRRLGRTFGVIGGVSAMLVGTVFGFIGLLIGITPLPQWGRLARGAQAHYERHLHEVRGARYTTLAVALRGEAALRSTEPLLLEALRGRSQRSSGSSEGSSEGSSDAGSADYGPDGDGHGD